MSHFVEANRDQPFLLPPDLREWVPEDDLAHFVLEAVERVDLRHFRVNERGSGSPQYPPRLMLALLIYGYANGLFSSRRIERATYRDLGVRYLAANTHPDHDTICKFRRENEEAIAETFLQVLLLARELKLLTVGTVSVDGTKLDANASLHKSVRYDRAGALVTQLQGEIAGLLAQAEAADAGGEVDVQALPAEIARREALRTQLDAARSRLEAQAAARASAEQAGYEAKVHARDARSGRAKGKHPKPPSATPAEDEQSNLTDPDSRIMRKTKRAEYRQGYNAQAVVDADGSYLILGARVSQCASDRNELGADIRSIPVALGTPTAVLADNGYAHEAEVATLEDQSIEVLVATGAAGRRRHDFRPIRDEKPAKEPQTAWLVRMRAKLKTPEARARYRRRQQTVEPVFGVLKEVLGFRRFHLRSLPRVTLEWTLLALAYNCKRLHRMSQAVAA
jgi:transposase